MKKIFIAFVFFTGFSTLAQDKLEDLIAAGIQDAQRFATGYISPATEGLMHNMANGWIHTAEVKKPLRFDISIMGNSILVSKKHHTFTLNTAEYNNLKFRDGSTTKDVATAFGENNPEIMVYSVVKNGDEMEEVEFQLPQGLASVNINLLPTAFLQARMGVFKGTEIKARYFPKMAMEDVKVGLYGFGVQHEFTSWLPAEKIFPVAISGVIAYSHVGASYDFANHEIVTGNNQKFDLNLRTWLFQVQASTKLRVVNFYGGLGYVSGNSDFDVLGNYQVIAGIPLDEQSSTFRDPFSVKNSVSDVRANIGANLRLGFFGLNADFTLSKYNSFSVGMHFGIN